MLLKQGVSGKLSCYVSSGVTAKRVLLDYNNNYRNNFDECKYLRMYTKLAQLHYVMIIVKTFLAITETVFIIPCEIITMVLFKTMVYLIKLQIYLQT